MTDIEREALYNEIDFLQGEVDKYREQNKELVKMIFKIKHNEHNPNKQP